jgi:hypothetical protein
MCRIHRFRCKGRERAADLGSYSLKLEALTFNPNQTWSYET